jgi:hypothetical protein
MGVAFSMQTRFLRNDKIRFARQQVNYIAIYDSRTMSGEAVYHKEHRI